jgi:hypothetical protein
MENNKEVSEEVGQFWTPDPEWNGINWEKLSLPVVFDRDTFTKQDVKNLMEIARKPLLDNLKIVQELLDKAKVAAESLNKIHESETTSLREELEKLREFKRYVHDRLDKMGVPVDPEPANNAAHGCRIEGRLNFIVSAIQSSQGGIEKS